MQYCSFENLPMAKHLWPSKYGAVICDVLTMIWLIWLRAGTGKMLFPPGKWAHRLGNSWLACLKPSALLRKSLVGLLCTGSVENTKRTMQEERLPDSSFNILPATTHIIWSPHLSDVSWFFYEKQNIMPSFLLYTHFFRHFHHYGPSLYTGSLCTDAPVPDILEPSHVH